MSAFVGYDATLGSLTLKQVRSGSFTSGDEIEPAYASGAVAPSDHKMMKSGPNCTFTSSDLATILGVSNVMTTGVAVSSGTISLPILNRTSGGTFASGSNHAIVTASNGHYLCESISWSQDSDAEATMRAWFSSTDGITNPTSITGSQSLSGASYVSEFVGATAALSYAGPTTTSSFQLKQLTVNSGVTITPNFHSGGVYPQEFNVTQQTPTIEITFQDSASAVTMTQLKTLTAAVIKLRKRSGVSFVAGGTGEHISFTFADAISSVDTVNITDGQSDGSVMIRISGEGLTVATDATFS